MGYFIDNPPEIMEIKTEICTRDGNYKDLSLTVKTGVRQTTHYIIHSDSRFKVEDIEKTIKNKQVSEDLWIMEYSERGYLFITVGDNIMQVTGRKL
ncbi:MAG: hypothetical protein AB1389_10385 [Campylobacterota bacterium]